MPKEQNTPAPNPKQEGETKRDLERKRTEESQRKPGMSAAPYGDVQWLGVNAVTRVHARLYECLRMQHWHEGRVAVVLQPKENVRLGATCPSGDLLDHLLLDMMAPDALSDILQEAGQRTSDYLAKLYSEGRLALDPFNGNDVDALVKAVLGLPEG